MRAKAGEPHSSSAGPSGLRYVDVTEVRRRRLRAPSFGNCFRDRFEQGEYEGGFASSRE